MARGLHVKTRDFVVIFVTVTMLTDATSMQLVFNGVEEWLHLSQGHARQVIGGIEGRQATATGTLQEKLTLIA
jgi:hypothetical protein